jgi:hypothetical protein
MNNFLNLLDIDADIELSMILTSDNGTATVSVNNNIIYQDSVSGSVKLTCRLPLLENIDVRVNHTNVYLQSLKFDEWEARPQYAWEIDQVFVFETQKPFYQWLHSATGQGWLLTPTQ